METAVIVHDNALQKDALQQAAFAKCSVSKRVFLQKLLFASKTTRKTPFANTPFAKRTTQRRSHCYSCLCCVLDAGQRLLWLPLNQYRVLPSLHAQGAFPAQGTKIVRLIRALRINFFETTETNQSSRFSF